jgi:hypothetical protein
VFCSNISLSQNKESAQALRKIPTKKLVSLRLFLKPCSTCPKLVTRFVIQSDRLAFKHTHPTTTLYMLCWDTKTLTKAKAWQPCVQIKGSRKIRGKHTITNAHDRTYEFHVVPDSQHASGRRTWLWPTLDAVLAQLCHQCLKSSVDQSIYRWIK